MTIDFRITVQNDGISSEYACSIKYSNQITSRELQKMEIMRRYYESLSIIFRLVTEKDIPWNVAYNVDRIHDYKDILDWFPDEGTKIVKIAKALTNLVASSELPLSIATNICDHNFDLKPGDSLSLAYYLIANRIWQIDMNLLIEPDKKLILLNPYVDIRIPSNVK